MNFASHRSFLASEQQPPYHGSKVQNASSSCSWKSSMGVFSARGKNGAAPAPPFTRHADHLVACSHHPTSANANAPRQNIFSVPKSCNPRVLPESTQQVDAACRDQSQQSTMIARTPREGKACLRGQIEFCRKNNDWIPGVDLA